MKRLFLLIVLLATLPAAGQTGTATLGGCVTDENGPIEGVTVVAIHQQTNAQYYTTTDRHGWWQLLDVLPGGPYTLRIHYFGYKPLTVRDLFTYSGQNTVVDADLEAGQYQVHTDEAATSLRIGDGLGGGVVPVSPLGYDLVGQRIYTAVPFDVRQEASLTGVSRQQLTPVGSNQFHGSVSAYYGSASSALPGAVIPGTTPSVMPGSTGHLGLTVATPIAGDDYQLFAGLRYDGFNGLSGTGRFDARFDAANRLDVSCGRLSGDDIWATAGFTSALLDGTASNRAQASWLGGLSSREMVFSDDFTLAAGPQRLLGGVRFAHGSVLPADSSFTRFDFYLQDAVRFGRRVTLTAGLRFAFPFAFSPRVSVYYDVMGTGALVLRAGTAVYGVHGEGTVWKNLTALDARLPNKFFFTLEGVYGQSWRRAFYISSHNVLDSHYALTARLERPLFRDLWAVASYTRADGAVSDEAIAGFSYRVAWLGRLATNLAVLYDGYSYVDNDAPASFSWANTLEARLSQDLSLDLGGRAHTFQLTGYLRYAPDHTSTFLLGLRYIL